MTIKSFTSEQFEENRIAELSRKYQSANQETIKVSSLVTPIVRMIILIGFLCTLWIGGYKTINHAMNVGVFSLLVFLTQRLLWPFRDLADVTVNYQRVMASTKRALDLLTWPHEPDVPDPKVLPASRQTICFDNVCFRYQQSQAMALSHLDLCIAPGMTVAFVGESGAGKSTMIKLLCRFYEPTEGEITYGGIDIRRFGKRAWRSQVALVSQDIFLFNGTVRENIAYALPEVSDEAIHAAAELAGAAEFIKRLPEGYQTYIGEQGNRLSGGQKQRIAIARAIVKKASILILDEATSAVDNETEFALQQAIAKVSKRCTTFLVAHRLSTVRHADLILVLDNGHVVEQGHHESLIQLSGVYARLWAIQVGEVLAH